MRQSRGIAQLPEHGHARILPCKAAVVISVGEAMGCEFIPQRNRV